MQIDVLLSAPELEAYTVPSRKTVAVAIDILRATTVMTEALALGAAALMPVSSTQAGRQEKERHPDWLLMGEETGLKPEGFDFGNSCGELQESQADIAGKTMIHSTTNGTRLIQTLTQKLDLSRDTILAGALTNVSALAEAILVLQPEGVVFCAAGNRQRASMEDIYGAAWMGKSLLERLGSRATLTDSTRLVLPLVQTYPDALALFKVSEHGQYLAGLGFEADLALCAQIDRLSCVGQYQTGSIVKL